MQATVLSQEELNEQLGYSRELGMPVGQVLVASGFLTQSEMLSVIQIQSLLLSNTLQNLQAVRIIRSLCVDGTEMAEALSSEGIDPDCVAKNHRLGELLLAAELLSEEELARALLTSADISSPLGHSLVRLKIVRPELVVAALIVQRQMRSKQITYDEGIARLRATMKFHHPFIPSDSDDAVVPPT